MPEFKIGQHVVYHPISRFKAEERYVVIAVYKQPDGEVRYVVRSQNNPLHEYITEAQELRPAIRPWLRSS
jgi:hypothetical protein